MLLQGAKSALHPAVAIGNFILCASTALIASGSDLQLGSKSNLQS